MNATHRARPRPRRLLLALSGLLLAFGALVLPANAASAQPSSCDDYIAQTIDLYLSCLPGPTITVNPGTTTPGGAITVDLAGWLPGSSVTITITCNGVAVTLGNVAIGDNASGQGTFTVPSDCPAGSQVVTANGPNMLGVNTTREGPVVLTTSGGNNNNNNGNNNGGNSGGGGSGSLPNTGFGAGKLVTIGAALVVIGSAALYGAVRARRTNTIDV